MSATPLSFATFTQETSRNLRRKPFSPLLSCWLDTKNWLCIEMVRVKRNPISKSWLLFFTPLDWMIPMRNNPCLCKLLSLNKPKHDVICVRGATKGKTWASRKCITQHEKTTSISAASFGLVTFAPDTNWIWQKKIHVHHYSWPYVKKLA